MDYRTINAPPEERFYRVAKQNDEHWIDLGDQTGDAIRITADGWSIISYDEITVPFTRSKETMPLYRPVGPGEGKFLNILEFCNTDENGAANMLAFMLAALTREAEYPIGLVEGEQNTGKTYLVNSIKRLIDPTDAGILTVPETQQDVLELLEHNHLIVLDNLEYKEFPAPAKTVFSRIATGGKHGHPVLLNGTKNTLTRGPEFSRGLLIATKRISPLRVRDLEQMNEVRDQYGPSVLGALLDSLVLDLQNNITPSSYHRMRKAVKRAEVSASRNGFEVDFLVEAIDKPHEEKRKADFQYFETSNAYIKVVEAEGPFEATVGELYEKVQKKAKAKRYLKSAAEFTVWLNDDAAQEEIRKFFGITRTGPRKSNGKLLYSFYKIEPMGGGIKARLFAHVIDPATSFEDLVGRLEGFLEKHPEAAKRYSQDAIISFVKRNKKV